MGSYSGQLSGLPATLSSGTGSIFSSIPKDGNDYRNVGHVRTRASARAATALNAAMAHQLQHERPVRSRNPLQTGSGGRSFDVDLALGWFTEDEDPNSGANNGSSDELSAVHAGSHASGRAQRRNRQVLQHPFSSSRVDHRLQWLNDREIERDRPKLDLSASAKPINGQRDPMLDTSLSSLLQLVKDNAKPTILTQKEHRPPQVETISLPTVAKPEKDLEVPKSPPSLLSMFSVQTLSDIAKSDIPAGQLVTVSDLKSRMKEIALPFIKHELKPYLKRGLDEHVFKTIARHSLSDLCHSHVAAEVDRAGRVTSSAASLLKDLILEQLARQCPQALS